jgi:hypothetical protein
MSIRSVVMAPHSPTCPPPPLEPPPPLPSVSRSLRVHLLRRCWSTGPSFLRHRRVSLCGHRSVPYPGCPPLALPRHFTGHHCQIWPLHCHESSSFVPSTSVGAGSESLAPGQSPSPRAPGHRSSPLLAPAPPPSVAHSLLATRSGPSSTGSSQHELLWPWGASSPLLHAHRFTVGASIKVFCPASPFRLLLSHHQHGEGLPARCLLFVLLLQLHGPL